MSAPSLCRAIRECPRLAAQFHLRLISQLGRDRTAQTFVQAPDFLEPDFKIAHPQFSVECRRSEAIRLEPRAQVCVIGCIACHANLKIAITTHANERITSVKSTHCELLIVIPVGGDQLGQIQCVQQRGSHARRKPDVACCKPRFSAWIHDEPQVVQRGDNGHACPKHICGCCVCSVWRCRSQQSSAKRREPNWP